MKEIVERIFYYHIPFNIFSTAVWTIPLDALNARKFCSRSANPMFSSCSSCEVKLESSGTLFVVGVDVDDGVDVAHGFVVEVGIESDLSDNAQFDDPHQTNEQMSPAG